MVKLDVDSKNGGLKLDEDFLIDFGEDKNDILLAHEMRWAASSLVVQYLDWYAISKCAVIVDLFSDTPEVTVLLTYGYPSADNCPLAMSSKIFTRSEFVDNSFFNVICLGIDMW